MVVSFINLKGGVGKTTLCLAIGEWLAVSEEPLGPRSVLFVDLDPQCNLSSALMPFTENHQQELKRSGRSGRSVFHMFHDAVEFLGTIFNRVDQRRRDPKDRIREVHFAREKSEKFLPFLIWVGDWRPLYEVSNYLSSESYGWSDLPSKYGGNCRVAAGLLNPLIGKTETKAVSDVVCDLAKEFHERCRNGPSWFVKRSTVIADLIEGKNLDMSKAAS